MVSPSGSAFPKYLRAMDAVMTTDPRILQRLIGIAPHQWEGKNIEDFGIRPEHAVFEVRLVLIPYDPPAKGRTEAGE